MSVCVVVARYQEDLTWLADVPAAWSVRVYDKSGEDNGYINRPNVGREAETFCHHNATEPPAEWTVFLQGNPFDHWPNPIQHAQRIIARGDRGDRVGWLGYHYDTDWNQPPHTLHALDFATTWYDLGLEGICPTRLSFPAGAQMVVHKSAISSRHRAWWQRAAEVTATEDWRVAHCLERLWPVIYR